MAALTKTVGVFPKERAIVDRERAKGSYALGPYLLSKLLAEIPIGAAFPLMFGAVLYPMARLHPTLLRSELQIDLYYLQLQFFVFYFFSFLSCRLQASLSSVMKKQSKYGKEFLCCGLWAGSLYASCDVL